MFILLVHSVAIFSSMATVRLIALFFFLFHGYISTLASDPDPVRDFCILASDSSCKNSSAVTSQDFVFSGLKSPGEFDVLGLSSIPANANVFPGLNSLGMSMVRADFEVDGVNVPHFHPRATEVAYVVEGKLYSGFVDSQNRIFTKVIEKGEVMVFPRGLVHFQMNIGDKKATIIGSFNSQNPGLVRIPGNIFGSGVKDELLEKAFGLSAKEVSKLKKRLSPHDLS